MLHELQQFEAVKPRERQRERERIREGVGERVKSVADARDSHVATCEGGRLSSGEIGH